MSRCVLKWVERSDGHQPQMHPWQSPRKLGSTEHPGLAANKWMHGCDYIVGLALAQFDN